MGKVNVAKHAKKFLWALYKSSKTEMPMGNPTITFVALYEGVTIPSRAHPTDSGMDIRSCEGVVVPTGGFVKVKTGVAAIIPKGYEIQVRPRSGLAAKNGVRTCFGTVDMGYRGEIGVTLFNNGNRPYVVEKGERIAQLVLCPVVLPDIAEGTRDMLGETDRGDKGFGSTGRL